ncbi:MFS transporter [Streptomyces hesseae]|uniref:MFS transporter n=1 Tax=Streptomyces hesseae TaxID=3075519 RepID=A0ABU2SL07_9ACTN|nr:MFS transporter [Streptomyces sp. DSM 40473]MDT0449666.1 MFS transporter [Streptomyces sp. DSM 40473]
MPRSETPTRTNPPTAKDQPFPPARRWTVLAVLSTSLLLCGIDLTVLHVSVPSMTRDLHPSAVELLWIVDVYSLTLASLLVTCGTLGDRIGRKRMVLSGFAVFGLASACAAFSATTPQLIAARVGLGAGAAMIMASTVAVIRVVFTDDRERAVAIGVWTAAHSVGATVGPLVGGLVTERWGWGAVFLVNVPIVLVILVIGARVIPESRNPAPRRWDLASVALSVVGLAGVVYALKRAGEHLTVDVSVVVTAAVGAGLLVLFVRRQRRLAEPLLDVALFNDRRFSTSTVCVISCFGSYVALLFFLTQWLQQVGGYSPLSAGLALVPLAATNAVGAATAPWLSARWGNRWSLTGALTACAAAFALLALIGDAAHYATLVGTMLVAGYGAGVVMTLGADSIMGAASPERSGEAAAIQETSFELGAGLGVAVLGTVLAAAYRTGLPGLPTLGPDDRSAVEQSFGGAEDVADRVDTAAARQVMTAARHAYDHGFTAVAAVAAAGLALTALLAALVLRPRGTDR